MTDALDDTQEVEHIAHDGEAVSEQPTLESIAREAGWKPKEEFDRDPERWIDAPAFLRGTADKLRESREQADNLRKESRRIAATTERVVAERIRQERTDAERLMETARETGDVDAAAEAARRLERTNQPQPEVQAWIARNAWFNANPRAQALAQGVCQDEAQRGATIGEQLQAAEAEVRRVYPDLFGEARQERREEPRREAPQTQGGARTAGVQRSGPKGFADLTPAAKDAYRAAVANAKPDKREGFGKLWLQSYFEEQQ